MIHEKPQRLFVGVAPTAPILEQIIEAQQAFAATLSKERAGKVRWSEPEQLHLTLHFLGQVPSNQIPAAEAALERATSEAATHLQPLDRILFLPSASRARVIALGAEVAEKEHAKLWGALKQELRSIGFLLEEGRPYLPHLTVGRLKNPCMFSGLNTHLAEGRILYRVQSVILYRSLLSPNGSKYQVLREFPLATP